MMNLEELDPRYVLYGALSVLDNRLQACQNKAYPDMTMKQHFLLVSVNLFGDDYPTLKQAGDLLGCSYQNVKRLADQLEAKGYLHIRPDAADKRKLRLVPTSKFQELDAEKNHLAEQFMSQLYTDVSEEELRITLKTIRKMTGNITEDA